MNIVGIDFEMANGIPGSLCAAVHLFFVWGDSLKRRGQDYLDRVRLDNDQDGR